MNPNERNQRLLRALAEERASHGHGSAAEIDQKIGKSEGYVGRILRGEIGLQVEMLFKILDALDADPTDFFARCVETKIDTELVLLKIERQRVGRGQSSWIDRAASVLTLASRPHLLTMGKATSEEAALADDLRDLEELRFSYPGEAAESFPRTLDRTIDLASRNKSRSSLEVLGTAVGIGASIDRMDAHFAQSARALRLALIASHQMSLDSLRANLLQRTSYVVGDQADYPLAVEIARQASDLYILQNDSTGIGKTLVGRAVMHLYLEDHGAALNAYRSALSYLTEDAWYYRYAAAQGIGLVHMLANDLRQAKLWADRAATMHKTQQGPNWWRLIWLQGEIALKAQDLDNAILYLREARLAFAERGNAFDIAAISLQLAKALFVSGNVAEMRGIAAEMMSLLKPLQRHKIASSAIHEFARAALTGEVTVRLLDRICFQLERGRASTRGTQIQN